LRVVSELAAVAIDGIEENFAGAAPCGVLREFDRRAARRHAAAVRDRFVTSVSGPFCVDRDHDALVAEQARAFGNQLRPDDRRRIQDDLVGAGPNDPFDVVNVIDPSADGQRHLRVARVLGEPVHVGMTSLAPRADVHEHNFVDPPAVQVLDGDPRDADREIPRELQALDDEVLADDEHADDTRFQHAATMFRKFRSSFRPLRWLFSGWNWTARMLSCCSAAAYWSP